MADRIGVGYHIQPDNMFVITAMIPARRNGEPNKAAMDNTMRLLATVNPDAFDPSAGPKLAAASIAHQDGYTADGGGIIAHEIAMARIRDLDDDMGAPGEPPRCKTGGCGDE